MAYFRKLPSGRWRAEVEIHGERESQGGFPTKREAQEWAAKIEHDLRAGKAGRWPDKTLRQALERYRDEISPTKASESFERRRIDAWLKGWPELVARRFVEVKPDHLQAWVDSRLAKVKPGTVKRESNTFSNVWTIAAKVWRWCPLESPWTFVRVPNDGPPRERRVSWQEIRKVCRALGYVSGKPPHNLSAEVAHAWLIALRTAMRAGEILSLTVGAVNLETRVIRLDKHKTIRYTGRPRFVPFTRQARRLLAVMAEGKTHDLFTVTDESRESLFRKAMARCNIKGMRFHDSRAEALTLLSRRVRVEVLQKISGHADINVLIRHYYRTTPEEIAAGL